MKYKDILWGIIIVVGLLVKPLFSTSTGGSEIFKKSSMTQEIFKGVKIFKNLALEPFS